MKILSVESSCDETAVAVVEDGRTILTDCIASQIALHRLYGGVVPELASRKHIEAIYALADTALDEAHLTRQDIDAIAVTYAPGLIGAVLVGVNFAKAAAYSLGVPLIPVHHIRGHIAANYLAYPDLKPPFLCLVVSGGHTLIVDVQDYTKFHILGTTRDDAAGECFDKIARVIGMPYPGGAALDQTAKTGDENKYPMPHTKLSGNPLDMSFSGLKTAALNLIHTHEQRGEALRGKAAKVSGGKGDRLTQERRRRGARLFCRFVKYFAPARHLVGQLGSLVTGDASFTDQEADRVNASFGAETQRVVQLVVLQQAEQQFHLRESRVFFDA